MLSYRWAVHVVDRRGWFSASLLGQNRMPVPFKTNQVPLTLPCFKKMLGTSREGTHSIVFLRPPPAGPRVEPDLAQKILPLLFGVISGQSQYGEGTVWHGYT